MAFATADRLRWHSLDGPDNGITFSIKPNTTATGGWDFDILTIKQSLAAASKRKYIGHINSHDVVESVAGVRFDIHQSKGLTGVSNAKIRARAKEIADAKWVWETAMTDVINRTYSLGVSNKRDVFFDFGDKDAAALGIGVSLVMLRACARQHALDRQEEHDAPVVTLTNRTRTSVTISWTENYDKTGDWYFRRNTVRGGGDGFGGVASNLRTYTMVIPDGQDVWISVRRGANGAERWVYSPSPS